MENVRPIGADVYEIDTRMAGCPGVTAGYLILADRPCLIETGTSTSTPTVRKALSALGIGPDDLATVVVTHIHLDHAGGVGDIAAAYPSAEIVVHERGARHLADPSRLLASARMVWGDKLDTLFGTLRPTEASRIRALGETGTIDLGFGRHLSCYYTPGHAKHHVGLLDSLTGDLYVGDAAGVYLPETGDLRPATPPPDFDLDAALKSIDLFRSLQPERMLFTHYGPVEDVQPILERAAEELRIWVDLTKQAKAEGLDLDHAVAMVREKTKQRYKTTEGDPTLQGLETLTGAEANVAGIMHWLDRTQQG